MLFGKLAFVLVTCLAVIACGSKRKISSDQARQDAARALEQARTDKENEELAKTGPRRAKYEPVRIAFLPPSKPEANREPASVETAQAIDRINQDFKIRRGAMGLFGYEVTPSDEAPRLAELAAPVQNIADADERIMTDLRKNLKVDVVVFTDYGSPTKVVSLWTGESVELKDLPPLAEVEKAGPPLLTKWMNAIDQTVQKKLKGKLPSRQIAMDYWRGVSARAPAKRGVIDRFLND